MITIRKAAPETGTGSGTGIQKGIMARKLAMRLTNTA
jgi:hypothetical protein